MSNTTSPKPPPNSGPYYVQQVLARSASVSAGTLYTVTNPGYHTRLTAYFNIHSLPGSASTTANIGFFATDPVNGALYAINTPGVARSATGLTTYMMGNVTTSGNSAINCVLPRTFTITISLSTGATSKEVVFSLGLEWAP